MRRIADLYALQELDLALDACRRRLAQVEEQMGEDEELTQARRAWEEQQRVHKELLARQRELEWQVRELEGRIAPRERKLYDGSIANPRELQSLQEEVASLKRHKGEVEDELLAIMLQVDEAWGALLRAQEEMSRAEARWRQRQEELEAEAAGLRTEIERLSGQRARQAELLDDAILTLYNYLRERRQGRAVAKVERGLCSGCRIALPTSLLQQARFSPDPVQCGSCERILYVS